MAKKAKCPKCSQEIEVSDNFKIHKNKKYHMSCYKEIVQEVYKKTTVQQDDKQELYSFICGLYSIKELTPMIKAQIEKYYNEHEFTYSGMLYTLKYFFETLEKDTNNCEGIGIIPYMYSEAKEFYILKNKLYESDFDVNSAVIEKVVKFKSKKSENPYLVRMEDL